jgi:non-heme chloroperoxidase
MTEIIEIPNRGHPLIIDSGWRELAETALAFTRRFSEPQPAVAGAATP